MKLDRDYSVRLYFILKNKIKIRDFVQDLDFFRDRFQLGKGYKLFANLKKILDPAIEEVNNKTDISVWHEYIKEGRAYKKIHFIIDLKEHNDKKDEERLLHLTASEAEPIDHSTSLVLLKSDGINPPSSSITTDTEKKEYSTNMVVTKNKNVDIDDEGELSDEQQADYDALVKNGVWPPGAGQFVKKYDHERLKRNIQGCLKSNIKGNIRDLGAVMASAIVKDTYKGLAEEQAKARERERERQKAEWEKAQQAEQARQEQIKKERAEEEELTKIREQYTPEELNAVMAKVKTEYDNNGEELTKKMEAKLKKYGINTKQFYFYRSNGKKFGDENLRSGKLEKAIKKDEIKIDFEVNLKDAKCIEKIIQTYYKNGKICPDEIVQELEKQGLTWVNFQSKYYEKFIVIGKGM